MTSITYGGVTDYYYYQYTGLRYRARLAGTYYRYLYNGERVLEELNDSGTMQARYTTEDGSYYGQWLHLYRSSGSLSRFPMYDNIGTARGLLDASGTATDWYELDTFGRQVSSSGTTPNPYRFGGGLGYITDPSGLLQLGQRFYWPELGRFVSEDPVRYGMDWYAYASNGPTRRVDPTGQEDWCFSRICAGVKCYSGIEWRWFLYGAQQDCYDFCMQYDDSDVDPRKNKSQQRCHNACSTIFPDGGGTADGIHIKCTKTKFKCKRKWTFKCESHDMPPFS